MREVRLLATPHLQGACVTVSHQVHGLFRLKGLRPTANAKPAPASASGSGSALSPSAPGQVAAAPRFFYAPACSGTEANVLTH